MLIATGALGKINYLYSNRLNIGKIRTEENILWSFAPHDISVMLALLSEMPARVSCHGGAYLNRASCIDSSPQSASTSRAPWRYALTATCLTSGAASSDRPPLATGPMISRR